MTDTPRVLIVSDTYDLVPKINQAYRDVVWMVISPDIERAHELFTKDGADTIVIDLGHILSTKIPYLEQILKFDREKIIVVCPNSTCEKVVKKTEGIKVLTEPFNISTLRTLLAR